MKRSQTSVFEVALMLLLFFGSVTYLSSLNFEKRTTDYQVTLESFADILNENDSFRAVILQEGLGDSTLDEDWSEILGFLNSSFGDYSLLIEGRPPSSSSIQVRSCSSSFGKVLTKRIVAGNDTLLNNYEFKRITLGVCY